jgi:hypothetical protein
VETRIDVTFSTVSAPVAPRPCESIAPYRWPWHGYCEFEKQMAKIWPMAERAALPRQRPASHQTELNIITLAHMKRCQFERGVYNDVSHLTADGTASTTRPSCLLNLQRQLLDDCSRAHVCCKASLLVALYYSGEDFLVKSCEENNTKK